MPRKSAAVARKNGKLSTADRAFVQTNAGRMSCEEMAAKLGRSMDAVNEALKSLGTPDALPAEEAKRIIIRKELKESELWKNLKEEFVPDELLYFEEAYIKLMSQFKGDVLASEETQIFQAVKLELLMSRNLKERKRARIDIERMERLQADFFRTHSSMSAQDWSDSDKDFAMNLETQLATARAAEQNKTGEYTKLQERHEGLMKSLKSTRDQRVKTLESGKVNYLSIIKMLSDREVADREGRQQELIKLAGKKEYERLGRPTTFADGNQDNPILSADTVDLGPEENPHPLS